METKLTKYLNLFLLFYRMLKEFFLIFLGILGLWFGSDHVVAAFQRIAKRVGISELFLGLTIASIGTSLPEIFTNLMAGVSTLEGTNASGIAIGNIIGSNIAQITIILGIVALFSKLFLPEQSMKRDGMMLFLAIVFMFLASFNGIVSRTEAFILVSLYVAYIIFLVYQEKVFTKIVSTPKTRLFFDGIIILVGILTVAYSSKLVVSHALVLSDLLEISKTIMGIFIGLGATLPEFTLALTAVYRGAKTLSLGTLVGSGITNPLFSFGLGAIIAPVAVTASTLFFDFPFWAFATLVALFLLFEDRNLDTYDASILIILYLFFVYLRIGFFA